VSGRETFPVRSPASVYTETGGDRHTSKNGRTGQVMRVTYDRTATDLRARDPRMSVVSLSAWNSGSSTPDQGAIATIDLRPTSDRLARLPTDLR
jgi:hypothetical protein